MSSYECLVDTEYYKGDVNSIVIEFNFCEVFPLNQDYEQLYTESLSSCAGGQGKPQQMWRAKGTEAQ